MTALLELRGIGRAYRAGDSVLTVLDAVDLDIDAGDMVAIIGPSGATGWAPRVCAATCPREATWR